ncbi:MAG: PDDEXK nuclease domain-containing protein [Bacteroidota bacterium]|nr:PDDEXK nuclease domain-containing protein [Bacteroidota bacterium]
MAKGSPDREYKAFLREIKERVYQSQYEAMKQVNKALIGLYWEIGKSIAEKQQQHKWGKSIVERLAEDLQKEFPGMEGFSSRNVWRMRMFYLEYRKLPPMVAEIGWSHNILIIEKCKDELERKFYTGMTKKYGWTKNVLAHHLEGKSYERFLLGQTNFDKALPRKYKHQAKLAVRDEYNFEFLEIKDEHNEKELEGAIMKNMRKFLIEMGGDFAFIGNQYRLKLDEEDYSIDILLYHRRLKALVAIELKAGTFKPEHAGKMNFYLSVLNDKVKTEDENPSIGIIVCKEKNRTIVEYALKEVNQPIGVASYRVIAKLPRDYKKYLPSPQTIIESLSDVLENMPPEE